MKLVSTCPVIFPASSPPSHNEIRFFPQIVTSNKKDFSNIQVTKKGNNFLFCFLYVIKLFICGITMVVLHASTYVHRPILHFIVGYIDWTASVV